jgi:hypothetical protein
MRCNAPDSCAGQALRAGGALLIGVRLKGGVQVIVTSKPAALITDGQRAIGELWTITGQRTKCRRWRVEGSCRRRFLKVTVLSLRTTRSCLLDNTSSNSNRSI